MTYKRSVYTNLAFRIAPSFQIAYWDIMVFFMKFLHMTVYHITIFYLLQSMMSISKYTCAFLKYASLPEPLSYLPRKLSPDGRPSRIIQASYIVIGNRRARNTDYCFSDRQEKINKLLRPFDTYLLVSIDFAFFNNQVHNKFFYKYLQHPHK